MALVEANHPNWQTFSDKAGRDVLFVRHAYKYKDDNAAQAVFKEIQSHSDDALRYQIFLTTDHLDDTKKHSYRSVCFVDHKNKELTFATCGTRRGLDQVAADDLYDDAMLFLRSKPLKAVSAHTLNEMILDSLGEQAAEYKYHFTGHSLGAAVAQIQAADMDLQLRQRGMRNAQTEKQISSITFENPGCKSIIADMYKAAGQDAGLADELNMVVVQNRKNMINSLNQQQGKTFEMIPSSQEARKPNLLQKFFAFLARLTKGSRLLSKAFSLLAPGGIGSELLNDHSLGNFNETFVKGKGLVRAQKDDVISLEEAYSGLKLIKFDRSIFDQLSSLQPTKNANDKPEFVMQSTDAVGNLLRVTCSRSELAKCLEKVPPQQPTKTPKVQPKSASFVMQLEQQKLSIPTAQQALAAKALSR